jgi:DNA mismatch endonuclease (patch repair protein)
MIISEAGIPKSALPSIEKRRQMARVRTQDTGAEIAVRRAMHARGLRFRLHRPDLPGRPDIVLSGHGLVVFVHGCYWHGCARCDRGTRRPRTNVEFWSAKLAENQRRDAKVSLALKNLGWDVAVIWECETKDPLKLAAALDGLHLSVRIGR